MEYKEYQQFNKAEEAELFRRMKSGDEEARQLLIESQLAWIRLLTARVAKKIGSRQTEDAESAAQLRFIEILDRKFDPERGRLSTLVGLAIPRYLSRWWNQNYLIKPPMSPPSRCANPEAIANAKMLIRIDTRAERTNSREASKSDYTKKMREIACYDEDQGERLDQEERAVKLRRTISKLPRRSRKILRMRMNGKSLQEVGDCIGVSKERVRQIQRNCHEFIRLRHPEWWK